jgi:peptidoglycan/xylan/chitin deacetylase (PgdA/CDA1 family)
LLKYQLLLVSWLLLVNSVFLQTDQRGVVIRIDDVEDLERGHPFAEAQRRVLEYQIEQRIPALIAIIASEFGSDKELLEIVKRGIQAGVLIPAIHGWYHEPPLSDLTSEEQLSQIRMAREWLESVLGVQVKALVPPFGKFNSATIDAARKTNITLISSSIFEGDTPRLENGILFIPETVSTAEVDFETDSWVPHTLGSMIDQIKQSWTQFGTATVVIHPRQFLDMNQTWDKTRWNLYTQMIEWTHSNVDGQIIRADDARPIGKKNSNLDWFLIGGVTVAIPILVVVYRSRNKAPAKAAEEPVGQLSLAGYVNQIHWFKDKAHLNNAPIL